MGVIRQTLRCLSTRTFLYMHMLTHMYFTATGILWATVIQWLVGGDKLWDPHMLATVYLDWW